MNAKSVRRPAAPAARPRSRPAGSATREAHEACAGDARTTGHAALRRRQILDAAEECFRRRGFHNASMAEIAKSFGMSAGHIYNYFDSKEAIIAAIVERDLEDFMRRAADLQAAGDVQAAMLARIESGVENQLQATRAGRQLEVLAEAGRNAEVLAMVQEADAKVRDVMRDLFRRSRPDGHAGRDLDGRVTVLLALFEGLMMRGLRQRELPREEVTRVLRAVVGELMR